MAMTAVKAERSQAHSDPSDLPPLIDVGHGLSAGVVMVTPERAKAWLATRNTGPNRRLSNTVIDRYAREMAAGRWALNGEPIIFSIDGSLANGQHRLSGIVKSRQTVPMFVVVIGHTTDVMATLDQGKSRTQGDVLSLAEVANANVVAAMAAVVVRWEYNLTFSTKITPAEELDCLRRHPTLPDSYLVTRRSKDNFRSFPHSMIGALHYLFSQADPIAAAQFMDRLIEGCELAPGDPVLTLRNVALRNQASRRKIDGRTMYIYIVKAWNATYRGEQLKLLKAMADEPLPDICGAARPF